MSQNVRNYTDQQLLDRVASLPSFKGFPQDYWLIGVRSQEDAWNTFDDKAYLFKGTTFIETYRITTNAGTDLVNPTNSRGEAVLGADGIYYDSWGRGRHRGKVEAYVQVLELPIYRDKDRDRDIEELGKAIMEIVGINIHPATYLSSSKEEKVNIGVWSMGCQVFAKRDGKNSFNSFMNYTKGQKRLTYALLNEFDPEETTPLKPVTLVSNLPSGKPSLIPDNPFVTLTEDDITKIIDGIINVKDKREAGKDPIKEVAVDKINEAVSNIIQGSQTNSDAVSTKENPSWRTILNSTVLQILGKTGLVTAIYEAIMHPQNTSMIIILVVIGLVLVGLGVWNYRKSAAESQLVNMKKLELLADPSKNNPDLV